MLEEIAMQNKIFSADFRFSSPHPCSSINEEHVFSDYPPNRYREANPLLDVIKEALIEKHMAIDYYHQQHSTFQCSESDDVTVDKETWNLGKALCHCGKSKSLNEMIKIS